MEYILNYIILDLKLLIWNLLLLFSYSVVSFNIGWINKLFYVIKILKDN